MSNTWTQSKIKRIELFTLHHRAHFSILHGNGSLKLSVIVMRWCERRREHRNGKWNEDKQQLYSLTIIVDMICRVCMRRFVFAWEGSHLINSYSCSYQDELGASLIISTDFRLTVIISTITSSFKIFGAFENLPNLRSPHPQVPSQISSLFLLLILYFNNRIKIPNVCWKLQQFANE